MPRIESVRLNASGSGSRAVITVSGTIVWDDSDASRNGVTLFVHFWGEDGSFWTGPDDNRQAKAVRIYKGSSQHETGEDYVLDYGSRDTTFRLAVRNHRLDDAEGWRRFDEDTGPDQIYARVALQEIGGTGRWLTDEVRTNTVRGRF